MQMGLEGIQISRRVQNQQHQNGQSDENQEPDAQLADSDVLG
jgi:hypothetical protein